MLLAAGGVLAYRLSGRPGPRWRCRSRRRTESPGACDACDDRSAVTACLVAFAASLEPYRCRLAQNAPSSRWWIPGAWFGAAVLAKLPALVFAPLIAAAALAGQCPSRVVVRDIAKMTVLALVMAFVYCGSDWQVETSFVEWARSLPASVARVVQPVAEHLPIFSNAGEAIVQQVGHNIRGHDTYLLGQAHRRAVWFYFPVVFLIKASGAVLVGAALLALAMRRQFANWVLGAVALLLLASPLYRVQNGIRMILPVLALAIVGLAVTAVRSADARHTWRVRLMVAALGSGSVTSARASGRWRAVRHEFWGGPDDAYLIVSDSNVRNWGQVARAQRVDGQNGRSSIDVRAGATDPALAAGPWQPIDIDRLALVDERDALRFVEGRELAVSTYAGFTGRSRPGTIDPADEAAARSAEALRQALRSRPWSARTRTFLVYDFRACVSRACARQRRRAHKTRGHPRPEKRHPRLPWSANPSRETDGEAEIASAAKGPRSDGDFVKWIIST